MDIMPIIIDTDPGIDDAAALTAACFHPELDIRLITTVCGNVSVEQTTENALKLLSFLEKDIPVSVGCNAPLLVPYKGAGNVHGKTGMDGYDFPPAIYKPIDLHAVNSIRIVLEDANSPITLVTIGSLTNVALLFSLYPYLKTKINRIIMMGGSLSSGNITSSAEFNIFVDPHSAQIVFQAGVPIVMIGLDVTRKAALGQDEIDKIQKSGSIGNMLAALFSHYEDYDRKGAVRMHDLCTIAYLSNPDMFSAGETHIEVVTEGLAAGTTIAVDPKRSGKKVNASVCMDIDVKAFKEWAIKSLSVKKREMEAIDEA